MSTADAPASQIKKESTLKESSTKKSSKDSGLMAAVIAKDIEAAKVAIKSGSSVNDVNEHGWFPLRKATRHGDLNMVMLLIEHKADVTISSQVAIITAASWGRTDCLRQMLEANANVGPDFSWEMTPLRCAAFHGHLRVIKLLLEFQADINQRDEKGDAITTAWDCNRSEIVLYLVEQGANLRGADDWLKLANSGTTALMIAEGIARRNERRINVCESQGVATIDTYSSGVVVPLQAFCKLMEFVPNACLVLFDKVLLKAPKDAPTRGFLNGRQLTDYLDIKHWEPKEEPRLRNLVPTLAGSDTFIRVMVFHQQQVLDLDVLFHLTVADEKLFGSHAITALLQHTWDNVVKQRFYVDIAIEFVSMVSLLVWALNCQEEDYKKSSFVGIAGVALGITGILTLRDMITEAHHFQYFTTHGRRNLYCMDVLTSTGGSIGRWMRILFGACLIASCTVAEFWNNETPENWNAYHSVLTVYILVRWSVVLSFWRGISATGVHVIPILNCFRRLGPYCIISFMLLLGFGHSIASFDQRYYSVDTGDGHGHTGWHSSWKERSIFQNVILEYRLAFLKSIKISEEFVVSLWINPEKGETYGMCGKEWFGKGCYRDEAFQKISVVGEPSIDVSHMEESASNSTVMRHYPYINQHFMYNRGSCQATQADFDQVVASADLNSAIHNPGNYGSRVRKATIHAMRWFDHSPKEMPPTKYDKMDACVHSSYRAGEYFWVVLAALVLSLFLGNVFIAFLSETFDFEQKKATISFGQERCHLCFRYLISIQKNKVSPIEILFGRLLKIFSKPPKDGYLWVSCVQGEDSALKAKATIVDGRLGYIKHHLEASAVLNTHSCFQAIEKAEVQIGKDLDTSISDLKKFHKEIVKSLKKRNVQQGASGNGHTMVFDQDSSSFVDNQSLDNY